MPATLDALAALRAEGVLKPGEADFFITSYRFLRTMQARMRLMSTTARDTCPKSRASWPSWPACWATKGARPCWPIAGKPPPKCGSRCERLFEVVPV